jgi:hypothetical protein
LAGAKRYALSEYRPLIPQRVRDLLDAIPPWLGPEVEIVDGELFRTDVTQEHSKTKEWVETQTYYHEDPALTLADYFVLGSWRGADREAELKRLDRKKTKHQKHLRAQSQAAQARCWGHAGKALWLQAIPLVVHMVAVGFWPALHYLAVIVSVALLSPVYFALKEHALARQAIVGHAYYVLGLAAAVSLVLAFNCGILGVLNRSIALVFAGLCLLAGSVGAGNRTLSHLRSCPHLSSTE